MQSEKLHKWPRATAQTLHAAECILMLPLWDLKVHDSTIRKKLNKCGLFGWVHRGKSPLCLKRIVQMAPLYLGVSEQTTRLLKQSPLGR